MKYGIITIDTPGSNRGNRLIEYAAKKVLNLPEPSVAIPMFVKPDRSLIDLINQCDFVLLPGATILAKGKGQGETMDSLKKIKPPKFCIGAAGWHPPFKLNIKAMKRIDGPLGVRDLYTYDQCKKEGISVRLVGCPTMLLPAVTGRATIPYDIIGFARKYVEWQVESFFKPLALNRGKKLVASLQEVSHELPIARRITEHVFNYDDPAEVMRRYAEADFVYTGRLHGVLPAISQKKPVIFFGDPDDSRFTLLTCLGVPVNTPGGDPRTFESADSGVYDEKVRIFKDELTGWKNETIDRV